MFKKIFIIQVLFMYVNGFAYTVPMSKVCQQNTAASSVAAATICPRVPAAEIQKRNHAEKLANFCDQAGMAVACLASGAAILEPTVATPLVALGAGSIAAAKASKIVLQRAVQNFDNINDFSRMDLSTWEDGNHKGVVRYPINPVGIRFSEAFKAWELRANYGVQFAKMLAHLAFLPLTRKETKTKDVIDYALNSSVLPLMTNEIIDGELILNLDDEDFKSSFYEDGRLSSLHVEIRLPVTPQGNPTDYAGAKITRFEYNHQTIHKPSEQLLILSTICAFTIHPLLHSFFNDVYTSSLKLDELEYKKWEDLFIHGQFLNECAYKFPADCVGVSRSTLLSVFTYNVKRDVTNHGSTVRAAAPYSWFSRFLLASRGIMYKLVKKYQVPVNPESLFLTTVMHSLDHYSTGKALLNKTLDTEVLPSQRSPEVENFMWYLPSENVFTNRLKDKRHKHPFYDELYTELEKLDSELAGHVTCSISY
ncbi:MAG: hypothetical protein OXT67_03835 [Zetaproteobacteria bacterium]|nr:hypothetical protein [Zetaproteobacteria bacterium]